MDPQSSLEAQGAQPQPSRVGSSRHRQGGQRPAGTKGGSWAGQALAQWGTHKGLQKHVVAGIRAAHSHYICKVVVGVTLALLA